MQLSSRLFRHAVFIYFWFQVFLALGSVQASAVKLPVVWLDLTEVFLAVLFISQVSKPDTKIFSVWCFKVKPYCQTGKCTDLVG